MNSHCSELMVQFQENKPTFEKMLSFAMDYLKSMMVDNNINVTVEGRVKTEKSLAGKLELKGEKYREISDVTDLVGVRIITYYSDEVDKIASLVEKKFEIDWKNSIDKRKMHDVDHFGYMSLHYICKIPASLYSDPSLPRLNEFRFELQMRTALQHVWATIYHDTGYKSDIEMPREYIRPLTRMAVVLEIADEEFRTIRTSLENYRRKVRSLLKDGKYKDLELDGESFRHYLELEPFYALTEKIASANNAEVQETSGMVYLPILKQMGLKMLSEVEAMRKSCSDDAYRLALSQMSGTDLDIISSTLALQNLCLVYIVKSGHGEAGLKDFYDRLHGVRPRNAAMAHRMYERIQKLLH